MKNILICAVGTAALLAALLGDARPAVAAPAGPSTVDATIADLEAQGYTVIVDRIGTAVGSDCSVRSVRPGQLYSRTDTGAPGAGTSLVTTLLSKTVYVDVGC
ncbi:hypothetical protein [Mycolicibacterium fluoranthenivorans]|uniref:PASTA domain-containing protein n=1 Tax=Mycolicibacterium fluoranthenivorans TaxID=258505 RepID=A0A1G4WG54_9MYCO|nr:hypothetical protein [Mycolicibacterium fluoranthenivorans]SCX22356.1 hypothetical protein SAMN02799620_03249 [Mycolicibacterium fluoranthenivorans]